jgi:hypothetical protein
MSDTEQRREPDPSIATDIAWWRAEVDGTKTALNRERDHSHDLRTRNRALWQELDRAVRDAEALTSRPYVDGACRAVARQIAMRGRKVLDESRSGQ